MPASIFGLATLGAAGAHRSARQQRDQRVEQLALVQRFGQRGGEQPVGVFSRRPSELNSTSGSVVPGLADARGQRGAVHARHVHVDDGQIEGSSLQHFQRLLRVVGVLHRHAPLRRLQRQDAPVGGVVVYHQQPLADECGLRALQQAPRARGHLGRARGDGEVEACPTARPGAFDPHRAAHQFGQPLADRQAEAGAAVLARGAAVGLAEALEHAALASASTRIGLVT